MNMGTAAERAEALYAQQYITREDLQHASKSILLEVSALVALTGVSSSSNKETLINRLVLKLAELCKMQAISDENTQSTDVPPSVQGGPILNVGHTGDPFKDVGKSQSTDTLVLELERIKLLLTLKDAEGEVEYEN